MSSYIFFLCSRCDLESNGFGGLMHLEEKAYRNIYEITACFFYGFLMSI